jgi:hypothetical protein
LTRNCDPDKKAEAVKAVAPLLGTFDYFPLSAELILAYFLQAFGYTRRFSDVYNGDFVCLLDAFINNSDDVLLEMFKFAMENLRLERGSANQGSYSYFFRYTPGQIQEFIFNVKSILQEKRKRGQRQVTILVPGSALGQEIITCIWLLEKKFAPQAPDFYDFDFQFIGIDINAYAAARTKIADGFDILTALPAVIKIKQQGRLRLMEQVNQNLEFYRSKIRYISARMPSSEFSTCLKTCDLLILNNVIYYILIPFISFALLRC